MKMLNHKASILLLLLITLATSSKAQSFTKIFNYATDIPSYTYDVVDMDINAAIVGCRGDHIYDSTYIYYYDSISNTVDSALARIASNIGSATIFEKGNNNGWTTSQKLFAPFPNSGSEFGHDVAINGDYAFVGEKHGIDNANQDYLKSTGAVHIYQKISNNWVHLQSLRPNDITDQKSISESQVHFGTSISTSGDYLVVGAPSGKGLYGFVYVYKKSGSGTYNFEQKLESNRPGPAEFFGRAVDIDGDHIVVSAPASLGLPRIPQVYHFVKNSNDVWEYKNTIISSDIVDRDGFGSSLAIHNNNLIIGTSVKINIQANGQKDTNGAVYFFELSNSSWQQVNKITNSGIANGYYFGMSVSLYNNLAVIGSHLENAMYIYKKNNSNTWDLHLKETNIDTLGGYFVDVHSNDIILGSSQSATGYIYSIDNSTAGVPSFKSANITLYPNPFVNTITIDLGKQYSNADLRLLDINGKEVYKSNHTSVKSINLNLTVNPGLYFAELTVNGTVFYEKLIKH